ncbi:MAG: superoxide dismutase [Candidatus Omnitrophica bacterium]|nr:superoxide dismutase [Candidatus Omnitrophota bacterium]
MKKVGFHIWIGLASVALVAVLSLQTFSHCQIPCGIYDDEMRFTMLNEHIDTIAKSMNQINELSAGEPEQNVNQLVRWVQNKENHADAFTEIVTQYFLSQRIKPADASDKNAYQKYTNHLVLLHNMMVHAMKAKQTTDLQHVDALRKLVKDFHNAYGSH